MSRAQGSPSSAGPRVGSLPMDVLVTSIPVSQGSHPFRPGTHPWCHPRGPCLAPDLQGLKLFGIHFPRQILQLLPLGAEL